NKARRRARSARRVRRRREEAIHLRFDPVLFHLGEEYRMNTRILIRVFDLIAAFLGAGRERDLLAENFLPPRRGEGIAQTAEAGREIARGHLAGRKMLMELLV